MFYFCRQDLFNGENIIEISGHTVETGQFLWTAGCKFDKPLSHQVLELDPAYGENLADFFDTTIPVMSDRLIEAFHEVRVDNFDAYPLTLKRKDNGMEYKNFKAVNFIGRIDAVDLENSQYSVNSRGKPRRFKSIIIDDAKVHDLMVFRLLVGPDLLVVNEVVANHLTKKNFTALLLQNTADYDGD